MSLFSFLLCNVFVAASKPTAQRNKTGFILYALNSPPLDSRVKNKTSFISLSCRFAGGNENITQKKGEKTHRMTILFWILIQISYISCI